MIGRSQWYFIMFVVVVVHICSIIYGYYILFRIGLLGLIALLYDYSYKSHLCINTGFNRVQEGKNIVVFFMLNAIEYVFVLLILV